MSDPGTGSGVWRAGLAVPSLLLVVVPTGSLLPLPTGPAGTGADVFLGCFAGAFLIMRWGRGTPDTRRALAVGLAFAAWCLLGAWWSPTPMYAAVKSVGYATLVVAAVGLARATPGRLGSLLDAWLLGAFGSIAVLAIGVVLGGAARERVLFDGGGITGLGFPRVRGPFNHPNEFGGYLAVTLPLLWARWEGVIERVGRRSGFTFAGIIFTSLLLTASSGWIGVGCLVTTAGLGFIRWPRWVRVGAIGSGTAVVTVVLAGALGGLSGGAIEFNGIRPAIWRSAAGAVEAAPVRGVGSTPLLGSAIDPAYPELGYRGWDAHQMPLSIVAQHGGVGALLFFGLWFGAIGRRGTVYDPGGKGSAAMDRLRIALVASVGVWAAHGVLIANEDFRHAWLLLGLLVGSIPQLSRVD